MMKECCKFNNNAIIYRRILLNVLTISSQSKFYKFDGLYQYIHQHSQHLLLQTYSQHVLNHRGFFPSLWQVPAQSLNKEVNRIV